jgi:transposase
MQAVTTIGLDIAKSVFQVHGVDAFGNVSVRRQLKRRQVLVFFQKLPRAVTWPALTVDSQNMSGSGLNKSTRRLAPSQPAYG